MTSDQSGPTAVRLQAWRMAVYSTGDLGLNVYWQGVSLFLFFFYTDVMGIPAWWAGFTIFIASVWDGITDPIMGGVADRTRTAIGRYRPYLLYGAPVLAIGFIVTFYAPQGLSGGPLIAYALVTHLLLRTLYTVVSIPYSALSARMTSDSRQRGTLAGWRMQGAALGGLTTAFSTPSIVQQFVQLTDGDQRLGWCYAAMAMAAVATLILWLCAAGTREPDEAPDAPAPKPGLGLGDLATAAKMLGRNGPLVRVFLCIIMASLCLSMMSKTLIYWFKYAIGAEEAASLALALTPLVLLFVAPVWAMIAGKTSKRIAWIAGSSVALIGYLAFFALPMREGVNVYLAVVFIALGSSSFAVMFWAMLPDTVEYDQWISGERHEAKVFGFASFAQKAALGLNALLLGVLLDAIGFVPNVEQSEATLWGMKAVMSLIPALGVVTALIALWGYPIDRTYHAELKRKIAARAEVAAALGE
ncbi:MAG: MFS transporter [Halieaceae bacterium]|jgi:GPH family glycoside/pentoside/hexuronide:cation symporter|nr:MFS transporter [Halieaceae bacterium]